MYVTLHFFVIEIRFVHLVLVNFSLIIHSENAQLHRVHITYHNRGCILVLLRNTEK